MIRSVAMSLLVMVSQLSAAQATDIAAVRAELERAYAANADAFKRWDLAGIMALRDSGFHTVGPDGQRQSRSDMEHRTIGLLNGIKKWNSMTLTIDSLTVNP